METESDRNASLAALFGTHYLLNAKPVHFLLFRIKKVWLQSLWIDNATNWKKMCEHVALKNHKN